MLKGHSPFGEPGGAVALAKVAAFHGHVVEPVHEATELGAFQLQDGDELDASGLEVVAVLGVGAGPGDGDVGELLQLYAGRNVLRADLLFDLAAGGGSTLGFDTRRELLQAEIALDRAHQNLLPLVILGIADDQAREGDPVGQDVDVLVLGIGVAGDEVLVFCETHAFQVSAADGLPLRVAQVLSRCRG